ncbi:MAG: hypothetical protein H6765_02115 [Candidatus Peribacteria bacterium]|nr:MAG: hypothetical protein H6765_02115 [Candidatus Peribacteria bacterium]
MMVYLTKQIDQRIIDHPTLRSTLSNLIHYQSSNGRRGSAGHTHVRLNTEKIAQPMEYWNVLTHEFGHIIDL